MPSDFAKQVVRYVYECVQFMKLSKHHSDKNKKLFNVIMFIDNKLKISRSKPSLITELTNETFQKKCKCIIRISIAYVNKKLRQSQELLDSYLMKNKIDEFIEDDSSLVYAQFLKDVKAKTKLLL